MPNDSDTSTIRNLLNDSQLEAVTYCDGPSLIVAGAGSGKTRVLTYKIAYLLQQGWHPSQILALTFTNKAADEMKTRIASIVGDHVARYLWMGTFHSIFLRILRSEAAAIGFTHDFTIYDQSDSKSLIRSLIKELKFDDKSYRPSTIQGRISFAKNQLLTPDMYRANHELMRNDANSRTPQFIDLYMLYCQRCKVSNAMDFDDLLLFTNLLFDQNPDILARYRQRFGYILVDEYQDTNRAQHLIIRQLASDHQRICVVGDDAQSIYSFRGANIDNMLHFQTQYAGCRLFKLERNYRSTQTIVNAANSLIAKNHHQIRKTVYSDGAVGSKIRVLSSYSDYDEAFAVAATLSNSLQTTGDSYSDYAILYRTNAQSRTLEEALRKRSIPYKIYGGLSFYQRKEVKDVLAYLRLLINNNDEEALKRIINYPARGIGETTQNKVLTCAHAHQVGALTVMRDMEHFGLDVNAGTAKKLAAFAEMMAQFEQQNATLNAYAIAELVVRESGIMRDILVDNSPENLSRKENIQELLSAINQFCEDKANHGDTELRLEDFLSEVALLTDQDTETDEDKNRVTLMTVHSAKGLEFKHIFIVGLEEDLFPSMMCDSERDLEEERRLLYVALTRAKDDCVISYAKSRFRNGQTQFSNPSRFIDEIDEKYLQKPIGMRQTPIVEPTMRPRFTGFRSIEYHSDSVQPSTPPARMRRITPGMVSGNTKYPYSVGMRVRHNIFGDGQIINIEGEGDATKAFIAFDKSGTKPLLLKYAKLAII
ncbi:MAG: ATP-dependent helicase [Paludibacteraceae bacterium]